MKSLWTCTTVALALTLLSLASTWAQRGRYGRGYPREAGLPSDRSGVPDWDIDKKFQHDVFTFVRIEYSSWSDGYRGGKWRTDYPDSDLNFSFRLQELTSLKVNPEPKILELTDDELFDYPFIYLIEPGSCCSARRKSRRCAATCSTAGS